MRTSEPGRSVASRILAVLEAFESAGAALSLSEIAERSGLPLSTVHRLVAELHEWGALHRDPQGRYQIGMRLWELGQNASRRLRETARPFLQDLFTLTGETAHLAVRENDEALYVDRIYGSTRVPRASRIGGRLPLHATAVGKVMLAYEADWFRDAYLAGELRRLTAHTVVDPVALAAELDQVRVRGYAIAGEEARLGACSIAVPVHATTPFEAAPAADPTSVGAAIGLVTLIERRPALTGHVPVLQGVARRIEAAVRRRSAMPGR